MGHASSGLVGGIAGFYIAKACGVNPAIGATCGSGAGIIIREMIYQYHINKKVDKQREMELEYGI